MINTPVEKPATYVGRPDGRIWIVRHGVALIVDLRIRGRKFHFATWRQ